MHEIELYLSAQYWRFCCHEADKITTNKNFVEWYDAARAAQMGGEL